VKAGASATGAGVGEACFSVFGGAGLEGTAGAGGRYSFMTFTWSTTKKCHKNGNNRKNINDMKNILLTC
jgi:hypothetical protein